MTSGAPDLLGEHRSAIMDGPYRYRLARQWDASRPALPFVMLNPSTANAEIDDPTIRRCMGFARRERAGGIVVVNLFAFRATKPEAMADVVDPTGPENDRALTSAAFTSAISGGPLVCAWGAHPMASRRAASVVAQLQGSGARLVCLGKTAAGHPRHPLYVRADQPFEGYP